ncbi:MAG: ArnB2: UDP-4-amino-4-deoxy-L-arabinose-oxoglutarate aminotransferase [Candidatus Peregrinibacteria bacterium GW2011_GWA2_33_10]|nr:MAG: ArnB2: UDP-4-amino-4-deoxy-L-arabinose-oxoglutarate aminotransferase [Candidatus Peregrinibacteria bacterium GW2011_GWA2_33_10]KKP38888.1 MAG: glutamine-scyllo-inositol transaminase [Candidatus Peregrinibacteria bacterium GW2011_GWC2_33_13]
MKVEFCLHNINPEDIKNAEKALKSIFITTGKWVEEFENNLAHYVGAKYGLGLMSCTHGLELALRAYNIGQGDEVITTAMSFIATANAAEYVGAKPVFVDIEEDTGNIDANQIEKTITKKTKAIIPVHLYGQMCDMKKIKKIADKYKLKVIEDAAHCIEGKRENYQVGEYADMACYSFYATKNITCGEGGAITLNDENLYNWLKSARIHGMGKDAAKRYILKKYQHQQMDFLGMKANMNNIQAALLKNQLKNIDRVLPVREKIASIYDEAFKNESKITPIKILPECVSARHLYVVKVPSSNRDQIIDYLQSHNIGCAVNYLPIHLMKYYRQKYSYKEGDFKKAEKFGSEILTLPLYPKLGKNQQEYVISQLLKIVKKCA